MTCSLDGVLAYVLFLMFKLSELSFGDDVCFLWMLQNPTEGILNIFIPSTVLLKII
jgi:hypothetical protein